jgi:hypothetical protein
MSTCIYMQFNVETVGRTHELIALDTVQCSKTRPAGQENQHGKPMDWIVRNSRDLSSRHSN